MRWSFWVGTLGLAVAGLVGTAYGQAVKSNNQPTYTPGYAVSPGCEGPGRPLVIPPGNVMPGPISPSPMPMPSPGNPTPRPSPSNPSPTPSPITPAPTPGNAPPSMATPSAPSMDTSSISSGAPEAGSGATASAAPNMIGDFISPASGFLRGVSLAGRPGRIPLAQRGGFKIAENESPRPMNRVFINYNYFNGVSIFDDQNRRGGSFDLHRETIGFEKTFLGGDASIGARLPILQKDGIGGVGLDGIGDLTIVTKFAAINDCHTGNVLSGGLVVTVPTGRNIRLANGDRLDAVLLQPWVGFIVNMDRVFVQGFSGLVFSTESVDTDFYSADIGIGYKLYSCANSDSFITQVIPTIEAHATIPIEDRGRGGFTGNASSSSSSTFFFPDTVVMTGGVHLGLCNQAFLTLGIAVPVTGQRIFDAEVLAQFNFRF